MSVLRNIRSKFPVLLRTTALLYFTALFYVVFGARRRWGADREYMRSLADLVPFRQKIQFLASAPSLSSQYLANVLSDVIGNFLLFILFPFALVTFFTALRISRIMTISIITSIAIELIQFILGIGVASADDVILNTLGALIGVILLRTTTKTESYENFNLWHQLRT